MGQRAFDPTQVMIDGRPHHGASGQRQDRGTQGVDHGCRVLHPAEDAQRDVLMPSQRRIGCSDHQSRGDADDLLISAVDL